MHYSKSKQSYIHPWQVCMSWYKFEVTILLHCPNWSLITVSFQSQVEIWELKIKRQCSPGKGQVLSCAGEGRA